MHFSQQESALAHLDNETIEKSLERQLGWVRSAESRLNLVLPLGTVLFGGMAIKLDQLPEFCTPLALSAWTSLVLIVFSIISAAVSVFPQTKGPKGSLLFFGTIAEMPLEIFIENMNKTEASEYRQDLLQQIHRNSQIASARFRWMKLSMASLLISLPFWGYAASKLY